VVDNTEDARAEHQAVKHRLRQLHEELERLERNLTVLQDGVEAEEETLRDAGNAVRVKASELESLQQHILLAHDQHRSMEQKLGQRLQHLHAADACISAVNEELQSKLQGLEHVFAEVDAAVAAREHEIARGVGVGETLVRSVSQSVEALAATAEQAQQAVAQQVGRNWSLARQTDALVLELQMLQDQTQEVTEKLAVKTRDFRLMDAKLRALQDAHSAGRAGVGRAIITLLAKARWLECMRAWRQVANTRSCLKVAGARVTSWRRLALLACVMRAWVYVVWLARLVSRRRGRALKRAVARWGAGVFTARRLRVCLARVHGRKRFACLDGALAGWREWAEGARNRREKEEGTQEIVRLEMQLDRLRGNLEEERARVENDREIGEQQRVLSGLLDEKERLYSQILQARHDLDHRNAEQQQWEREQEDAREALASELEQSRADLRELLSESEAQRAAIARERREREREKEELAQELDSSRADLSHVRTELERAEDDRRAAAEEAAAAQAAAAAAAEELDRTRLGREEEEGRRREAEEEAEEAERRRKTVAEECEGLRATGQSLAEEVERAKAKLDFMNASLADATQRLDASVLEEEAKNRFLESRAAETRRLEQLISLKEQELGGLDDSLSSNHRELSELTAQLTVLVFRV
jgi:chromosome segregation ATPase